jgi:hypothetical protein
MTNGSTNEYCGKHEWSAGMGYRCPDCVEVENLRDQLSYAWAVIASAGPEGCIGNWSKMDKRWVEAAERWRDKYHAMIGAVKPSDKRG